MRTAVLAAAVLGGARGELLGHWPFSNSYRDGKDFSQHDSLTLSFYDTGDSCGVQDDGVVGRFDNAIFFNDGCYASLPTYVSDEIAGQAARSICAWAKVDAEAFKSGGSESRVTCGGSSGAACGGALFSQGGTSAAVVYRGDFSLKIEHDERDYWRMNFWGDDAEINLEGSMDGQWHHYCMTYDGSLTSKLFYDGGLAKTHGHSGVLNTIDTPILLARNSQDGDNFAGYIDDVMVSVQGS